MEELLKLLKSKSLIGPQLMGKRVSIEGEGISMRLVVIESLFSETKEASGSTISISISRVIASSLGSTISIDSKSRGAEGIVVVDIEGDQIIASRKGGGSSWDKWIKDGRNDKEKEKETEQEEKVWKVEESEIR